MPIISTSLGPVVLLPAQASLPAKETLEWKTDLDVARDGTEYAAQIRNFARRSFDFQFLNSRASTEHFRSLINAQLCSAYAIPDWTRGLYVGNVANGATTFTVNTNEVEFLPGRIVLLYTSPNAWQVQTIDSVSGSSLTLSACNAQLSVTIYPIYLGYIAGEISRKQGFNAIDEFTFRSTDNRYGFAETMPTQYKGLDLSLIPFERESDKLETRFTQEQTISDYDAGAVFVSTPWQFSQQAVSWSLLISSRAERVSFLQWARRRAGKYRPFWSPSFTCDMARAGTGSVGTELYIQDNGFQSVQYRDIALQDFTGAWHVRGVTGVIVSSPGVLKLTLDAPVSLAHSEILCASYLLKLRLANDTLTLQYIGNDVARCNFLVREAKV